MLSFPKSTVFNRRLPKQKFYDNLSISSKVEQQFVKEIDTIYWRNKLAPDTLNITAGDEVTEVEVIEIKLKQQGISKNVIELIDREIPYHIVFVLRFQNVGQIWISYKTSSKTKEDKFKVDTYYTTEWMPYEDLSLEINGLDLDKVYESFITQVAGDRLERDSNMDIKTAIDRAKEKERLVRHINNLETKIRNEKQFNRQVKMMGELRKLKAELDVNFG